METGIDFLNVLGPDISITIFMCLEDVSDLVRVSAVSWSWRHHVIANGLCKQMCLKQFPQLSKIDSVVELTSSAKKPAEAGSSNSLEWENLRLEHRAYAFLGHGCTVFPVIQLIREPICASSTDNYPEESIENTLDPNERVGRRLASYWSSKGQRDPAVPETLTYKLDGDLCLINEINIQPFKAFFQYGLPIYSAEAVRFRMGHVKAPANEHMDELVDSGANSFVWTYTSEEFPMVQENRLQNFKFPEPVLCIGGILQVELLGRVQRQEMDGLFYICITHVQILGRSLSPAFSVDIDEPSKRLTLEILSYNQQPSTNVGDFRLIMNIFLPEYAEFGGVEDESDDEHFL